MAKREAYARSKGFASAAEMLAAAQARIARRASAPGGHDRGQAPVTVHQPGVGPGTGPGDSDSDGSPRNEL